MLGQVYYGWWIVIACFFMNLYVGGIVFFSFTAFFEPIQREFGWSYTQISLASSLRGLEMGIFAPVVGVLVDRLGSRKLLLFGSIIIGLGFLTLSLTQSLPMFYVSFLLIAFGAGGCTSVVTMTAVANWFHKNIGLALGIAASGFGAGGLLIPPIVALIDKFGWRITLILLGLGMLIIGIPLSLVVRNRSESSLEDGASHEKDEWREQPVEVPLGEAIKSKPFIFLNMAETIRMMAVTAVVVHLMPYLATLGFPRSTGGVVAAALPLVSILGRFGFGWWGDRYDKRVVLAAAFLILGGGLLVFSKVGEMKMVVLFLLLFSPGFGGSMVVRGAILREYFGKASFGKMLGIVLGSASIGGILGPTLAGYAFDRLGGYTLVWQLMSAVSMMAVVLALRMKPSQSRGRSS
jgi:MFS transporter, OFA family, oxalate/formate antiporter